MESIMTPESLRQKCAAELEARMKQIPTLSAFAGLDGFVDEIIHVVDKREDADNYTRLPNIPGFAERVAAAAGKSTNFELVPQKVKLGGNGPIMANALATFGLKVTYLGSLGWPTLHPVFTEFTKRADVHTICQPGLTTALEFEDGKLIMGNCVHLKEVNWPNIGSRFGHDKFAAHLNSSQLLAFVNWTMLPAMSQIWDDIQKQLCPSLQGPKRRLFIDLADPEKRRHEDIREALALITRFEKYFNVTLGLNEKEAGEIGEVLGLGPRPKSPEDLAALAAQLHARIPVDTIVVHPVSFALAANNSGVSQVSGPFVAKPLITTGAGDHFNAGFCLGQMLGLGSAESLLVGVSTSGFYVRTAQSPTPSDIVNMLRNWPSSAT